MVWLKESSEGESANQASVNTSAAASSQLPLTSDYAGVYCKAVMILEG